jgi:hypothetical protein
MCEAKHLREKIAAFHGKAMSEPHHRYRSWEHCHRFFRSRTPEALVAEKDTASLHLGFYLASWGMYRGSTFLLQHAYTIHARVVESLASPQFGDLWQEEIGSEPSNPHTVTGLLQLITAVKRAYEPFTASDILATKVILGTFGCLPAVDQFFISGFRKSGRSYSYLNRPFVERIIQFCNECGAELRREQSRIEISDGVYYPLMKLADMYFWQSGLDDAAADGGGILDLGE